MRKKKRNITSGHGSLRVARYLRPTGRLTVGRKDELQLQLQLQLQMSRIVIVITIYQGHKPIDSINLLGS
jgi:hypothetical protein